MALRPDDDESANATDWYAFLTEAQLFVTRELAAHTPESLYVHEKLDTADAGVSYDFDFEPLGHYEVRESPQGRVLLPAAEWEMAGDFVPAGQKIRFPGQKPRTFGNGPWARYVPTPGLLDASTEPTLKPTHGRQVLVPLAVAYWAERGGMRDPQPYYRLYNRQMWGDPGTGEVGLVGALKTQAFLQGVEAIPIQGGTDWWRSISDGSGYSPYIP